MKLPNIPISSQKSRCCALACHVAVAACRETATLAYEVMKAGAETRGDRFPAWQKDPLGETLRAIEGVPKD